MSSFATMLRRLGATGRQIATLATPIGEPVYVPQTQRPTPPAAPIINLTINIAAAPEEPACPIN